MTAPLSTVGVLIVDDDPLVRAGLVMMLGGAPDIRVVGEAGNGGEALRLAKKCGPDVVLMDIRMPTMDGLTATEALRAVRDAPEVVILTTFDADETSCVRCGPASRGSPSRTPRPPRSWPRWPGGTGPSGPVPGGHPAPHRPGGPAPATTVAMFR